MPEKIAVFGKRFVSDLSQEDQDKIAKELDKLNKDKTVDSHQYGAYTINELRNMGLKIEFSDIKAQDVVRDEMFVSDLSNDVQKHILAELKRKFTVDAVTELSFGSYTVREIKNMGITI